MVMIPAKNDNISLSSSCGWVVYFFNPYKVMGMEKEAEEAVLAMMNLSEAMVLLEKLV